MLDLKRSVAEDSIHFGLSCMEFVRTLEQEEGSESKKTRGCVMTSDLMSAQSAPDTNDDSRRTYQEGHHFEPDCLIVETIAIFRVTSLQHDIEKVPGRPARLPLSMSAPSAAVTNGCISFI